MTRNGKIARLPKTIRDTLNQRLQEGTETGRTLIDWLNSLPEVHTLMQAHFGGTEIREQNLSEWKKGGYVEWLRHQEAMALAERLYERAEEMEAKAGEKPKLPLSEVLSLWLAARYVVATQDVEATAGGEEGWKMLRQMCGDVVKLRRIDQRDEQLALEKQKVELQRAHVQIECERLAFERDVKVSATGEPSPANPDWEEWTDEQRIEWARQPENLERIKAAEEDEERRWREILGLPPKQNPPKPVEAAPTSSHDGA